MNRRFFIKKGALFVPFIFIPRLVNSQIILKGATLKGGVIGTTNSPSGGGGGGTYSLLAHIGAAASGNTPTTTSGINTTGAKLLVAVTPWGGAGSTPPSFSDSKGNTWTQSAQYVAFNPKLVFWYSISPTVGSGHTFTMSNGSGSGYGLHVYAFGKSSGPPAFDQEAAAGGTSNWASSTLQPGSVTPTTSADLFVTAVVWDVATTTSAIVDSGFTSPESAVFGSSFYGMDSAYKIKTDSSAENPVWTGSPSSNSNARSIMLCFK